MECQKGLRFIVWFSIYGMSLIFPLAFLLALSSFMVFGVPSIPSVRAYLCVIAFFAFPLSLLFAVAKMVSACSRMDYVRVRWYPVIPLIFFVALIAICESI